jgi:DNA-binding beta-propeller fold protein YncE
VPSSPRFTVSGFTKATGASKFYTFDVEASSGMLKLLRNAGSSSYLLASVPVQGAVHNVYVTPDGKFTVSGSVASSVISVIDTATDEVVWTYKETSGIRPMTFETNPDGSTRRIFVQLSDYHGVAVVDWATRKEVTRWEHAEVPGAEKHTDGLQAAPAHGLGIPTELVQCQATVGQHIGVGGLER